MPGYAASRSWTPLALTVGLHLLLVLAWLTGMHGPVLQPAPAERISTLVLVQPTARPRPAPVAPLQLPKPRTRSPAAISVPAIVSPAPLVPSAPVSEPAFEPQADPAPDITQAPTPGELLATSKAMAGKADRALRNGSSPITAEPERKWEGFAEAFAAARKGAPPGVTLESYTAPATRPAPQASAGPVTDCSSSTQPPFVTGLRPVPGTHSSARRRQEPSAKHSPWGGARSNN